LPPLLHIGDDRIVTEALALVARSVKLSAQSGGDRDEEAQ